MKICLSSKGKNLTDESDPRFGRCAWIIIYDTESGEYEAIENPAAAAAGGAGVHTAQLVVSKGARAAVSGSFGPNAHAALEAAGVKMYADAQGSVEEVIKRFKEGKSPEVQGPGASKKQI
ncbi:MAG: NifB/NifX family molybdenum-iron cluster-binding protein [Candidatus Goldiibacteriota bacterium]